MKKKVSHKEIDGLQSSAAEIKETKKQYKKRMKHFETKYRCK
jgi:hypothetical protein